MTKLINWGRLKLGVGGWASALSVFVVFGAVCYLIAVLWLGWDETGASLRALGTQSLLLGAVASCTAYGWRYVRWCLLLGAFNIRLYGVRHLAIYLSGLALTATPGKAGETFRSVLLLRDGVRPQHSLAAFLADRGSDVLGVCLLGALVANYLGDAQAWIWGVGVLALFVGTCVFAQLLRQQWFPNCARVWRQQFFLNKSLLFGQGVLSAWAVIWRPGSAILFAFIALVAFGTQALVFAWFCQLLDTGLSMAVSVLIFVRATLFGAASLLPGGLGAMEAALVYQMVGEGVAWNAAVSLAIAIRLVTLWLGMLIGVVALIISRCQNLAR